MNIDERKSAEFSPPRGWINKFRNAFAGVVQGLQGQTSFWVHGPATIFVVASAIGFQLPINEVALLLGCVALVLSLELMNSSIEFLAKAITKDYRVEIEKALNVASAAVLVASVFAVVVGLMLLGPPWLKLLTG